MHTNTNTLTPSPLVGVQPSAATPTPRPSVDEALAVARVDHEDWFWLFECQSNLGVPGEEQSKVVYRHVDPEQFAGTERFLIVLADSGMGKTAFLLNYYARHRRRWWWRLPGIELKLVPLNQPDANEMIAAVPEAGL